MNSEGYAAFTAWCIAHQVEPCGQEQYETWTTPRMQRYMRDQFTLRDNPQVFSLPDPLF